MPDSIQRYDCELSYYYGEPSDATMEPCDLGDFVCYEDHVELLEEAVVKERANVVSYVLDICDQLIEACDFNPEAIHELRDLLKDVYK